MKGSVVVGVGVGVGYILSGHAEWARTFVMSVSGQKTKDTLPQSMNDMIIEKHFLKIKRSVFV